MILAVYLEMVLCLSNQIFHNVVDLNREWDICVHSAIIFALAARAFKLSFLCDASLTVFVILNHLGGDALPASSLATAEHHYRLSGDQIEPVLAVEAVKFI